MVLGLMILAFGGNLTNSQEMNSGHIQYNAMVCPTIDRADGSIEVLDCTKNTLTNAGAELISDYIAEGSSGSAVDYIALSDASGEVGASAVGSTTLDNEWATNGLERSQGTFGDNGVGNWSIWETFTASADDMTTNKTGIFNASSTGTLFAENTFTLATLQTSDQITINWTIFVTEA